jgi:hypothetical protein
MTTQLILKPFVYMTQELIERIEKDVPKVSMASYTKESLQNMVNDVLTNKMKKEKYLSYCVGYIHDSVIHVIMSGKNHFKHDYEISYFIYNSAEEFNESLLEKIQVMFPDAGITIKKANILNFGLTNPVFYSLSIMW